MVRPRTKRFAQSLDRALCPAPAVDAAAILATPSRLRALSRWQSRHATLLRWHRGTLERSSHERVRCRRVDRAISLRPAACALYRVGIRHGTLLPLAPGTLETQVGTNGCRWPIP